MALSIDSLKRALGSFGRSLPGRARLDGPRESILASYDASYGGATAWNGAGPPSDPANNKEAAERYFTLITEFLRPRVSRCWRAGTWEPRPSGEAAGIAESGTLRTAMMLEHCGASAARAGELGIFAPLWVTIGRKP